MKVNKSKVYLTLGIILLLLIALTIAFILKGHDVEDSNNMIQYDISADCYSILLDDSYIFFALSDNTTVTFYRQYFDGRLYNIGKISDYVFNLGFHTLINNKLYFYITTAESADAVFNDNAFENKIFCVDLDENLLSEIYTESVCLPGAIISSIENYLISRQSVRSEENNLYTYIEVYDTVQDDVTVCSEVYTLNDNSNIGTYMMNLCTDGEYIYALLDERYENGTHMAYLAKYDINLEIQETINLDTVPEDIFSSRIGEVFVDESVLFLKNYSGDACVLMIEENGVVPIIHESGLRRSLQYTSKHPVFYIFGGTSVYIFSEQEESYVQYKLNLQDDYLIKHIMINGDMALVTLFAYSDSPDDTAEDKLYLVEIEEISSLR